MAWTVVSLGTNANTSGATLTLTGLTVPANAVIVVVVAEDDNSSFGTGGSVADGASNVYSSIAGSNMNGITTVDWTQCFSTQTGNALVGGTITYTKQGSAHAVMGAFYVTGELLGGGTVLDAATNVTAVGTSNAPAATSGTPGVADELFVFCGGWQDTNPATFSQSWGTNAFTSTKTSGGTVNAGIFAATFENTGSSATTGSGTLTASDRWAAFIFGFKPSTGTSYTLTPATGSYVLTGIANFLKVARKIGPAAGAFVLTGIAITLPKGRTMVPATGAYVKTGIALLAMVWGHKLNPAAGVFTLTGQSLFLKVARKINPLAGSFILTGQALALKVARTINPAVGSFILTGKSVLLVWFISPASKTKIRVSKFVLQQIRSAILYKTPPTLDE